MSMTLVGHPNTITRMTTASTRAAFSMLPVSLVLGILKIALPPGAGDSGFLFVPYDNYKIALWAAISAVVLLLSLRIAGEVFGRLVFVQNTLGAVRLTCRVSIMGQLVVIVALARKYSFNLKLLRETA